MKIKLPWIISYGIYTHLNNRCGHLQNGCLLQPLPKLQLQTVPCQCIHGGYNYIIYLYIISYYIVLYYIILFYYIIYILYHIFLIIYYIFINIIIYNIYPISIQPWPHQLRTHSLTGRGHPCFVQLPSSVMSLPWREPMGLLAYSDGWMDDLWKVRNDVYIYIYITEITWRCEVQLCFNKYVYTYICPNFQRSISYGCFQKSWVFSFQIIHFNRDFHQINHPIWGKHPDFGISTHI